MGEIRKIPQGFGGEIKVMLFFELEMLSLRCCEAVRLCFEIIKN